MGAVVERETKQQHQRTQAFVRGSKQHLRRNPSEKKHSFGAQNDIGSSSTSGSSFPEQLTENPLFQNNRIPNEIGSPVGELRENHKQRRDHDAAGDVPKHSKVKSIIVL